MEITQICATEANLHLHKHVRFKGHVQTIRRMGNLVFLVLRDRTGTIQAVVDNQALVAQTDSLACECPVVLQGQLFPHPRGGAVELRAESIELLSLTTATLPVEVGKSSKVESLTLSAMLDYRPLTLRNPKVRSIFKVAAAICRAFREFLQSEGFTEIHSPKIVSTGTEGGAQLFGVEYFGKQAYLAQSPQFYKQMMVGVFERVFEIGPVYRAEEHDTTRHLNEYISMDFEMGFIESEQDIIAMQTRLLSHIFSFLNQFCSEELKLYGAAVPHFDSIPQIALSDARQLLKEKYAWKGVSTSQDLDPEGERLLCEHFAASANSDLVYVTRYPVSLRPFYAMPAPCGQLSASFDLLFRGLEVTTGGMRIHEPEKLVATMEKRGLDPSSFGDYLQCFQYGMPPHGGLAIGLERLTKQLLGLPNVKLASLFPRDRQRLTP